MVSRISQAAQLESFAQRSFITAAGWGGWTLVAKTDFYLTLPLDRQHTHKMQIHIARNGQAMGPFSLEEINRQLAAGTLSPSDQAWYEGAAGWMPLSTVPGVDGGGTATVPSHPAGATVRAQPVAAPLSSAGKTEPLAIWSLVLSLMGLFCCGLFTGIPGVVCGHLALSKIEKTPGLEGHGLAVAGLIIGYFAAVAWIFYLIFFGGISMLQSLMHSSR